MGIRDDKQGNEPDVRINNRNPSNKKAPVLSGAVHFRGGRLRIEAGSPFEGLDRRTSCGGRRRS